MSEEELKIINEFMKLLNESTNKTCKRKFDSKADCIKFHQDKNKKAKYATNYYRQNKKLFVCQYCTKSYYGLNTKAHLKNNKQCKMYQDCFKQLENL